MIKGKVLYEDFQKRGLSLWTVSPISKACCVIIMGDGDFATCPYNPQHRMLKLRLQNHIVKCQRNYMTADMKPCPYNATHIVPCLKYRQHIQTCPDFVLIEGHRYNDDKPHGKLNDGAFHFDVSKDEEWETTDDRSDTSSEVSANNSKDCSQYFDLLEDFNEDDEPLQRYFFEGKKLQRVKSGLRLQGTSTLGSPENSFETLSSRTNSTNDGELAVGAGKKIMQSGAGRGRLFSILAGLRSETLLK